VSLEGIIAGLSRARDFERALKNAPRSADFSLVDGLRAPLLAALMAKRGVLFAIVATGRESEALRHSLECYLPHATVLDFPSWETLPHERLSPSAETVGRRAAALRALANHTEGTLVVVASVRAALQPMADNLVSLAPLVLTAGGRGYDLAAISSSPTPALTS
jgi:transcription-repair coupling factor (superfamily II helicase)